MLVNAFENQTGDRTLDWIGEGLASAIGDRLTARRELYVFGFDERVAEYERLGIPEGASVSRATAIRMAWDMGADVLVTGRISGTHEAFQINARILNLADDTAGVDVTVAGKLDEVIPMAANLASNLANQLVPGSAMPESDYATRPPVPRSAFEAYIRGRPVNRSSAPRGVASECHSSASPVRRGNLSSRADALSRFQLQGFK